MALVLADRIKETSTTTGTSTYVLLGAAAGFEAFSTIGNGNTTYYCCTDGVDFEVGIGTYNLTGTTLARTAILQSSNSDSVVVWGSGSRTLFCTQPAEKAVFLDASGNMPITNNATIGGTLDVTGSIEGASTLAMTGLITANAKIDLNGTELILDADADTSITADTDDQIDIRVAGADQITIKDGAISPVTDSDIDLGTTSLRYKDAFIDTITTTGNVTVGGDLTITGDDLTMATNTAGLLLIADGTNFNPTAVGDLQSISTVASGDVFLAVDASGGGLKQITRSAVVAGLATSSAISNLSEDDTPQLGGNLDMNGSDIVTTSNATLDLAPNGTGTVVVRGNSNSGAIVFNCESNSHGQTVQAQPHSASATNTMLLPEGANSTLVSLVSADTLTNKTLTTPTLTGTSVVASLDISGDIDVDGTTNLDVVDIDGAVNMATTALVTGVLTTTAATVFNGGFASNADSTMGTDKKIIFRDAAIHISSSADGQLDLVADTEIQIAATTIDIDGAVVLSADLTVGDDLTVNGGVIELRSDSGSVGQLKLYCESSNNHAQTISPQAHSLAASNTLTLPGGNTIGNANATLVSDTGTQTLTNKSLTAPTMTGTSTMADLDISGDVDVDGTLEADAITLNGTAITATATLSTGISNNNVPKFTSGVADDDFLRVNGTAIEGRSASEVVSDIGAASLDDATALAIALG